MEIARVREFNSAESLNGTPSSFGLLRSKTRRGIILCSMPHLRKRHILDLFLKRLRFFRVVSIQGARQTGKSFLAREILAKGNKNALYLTFDRSSVKDSAQRSPDTFILQHEDYKPLILDEAQKVTAIFDAVKAHVDVDTTPGQYVLLGSTEFSKELHIRESLTGRLGRIRIYPFNLAEATQIGPNPSKSFDLAAKTPRISRRELLRYLESGGFPGIFFIHDSENRQALLEDWLRLVLERDLQQFPTIKADSELAKKILEHLATASVPSASEIAKKLRVSPKRISQHLLLLKQLFVVNEILPHSLGSGKPRYMLCDAGLAHHLQASRERRLVTWAWIEMLSQHAYRGSAGVSFSYYRSARGGVIDLVVETRQKEISAFKILDFESIKQQDLEILRAFKTKCEKNGYRKISVYALAPVDRAAKDGDVVILPWESIA